jgi:hypothetical protein
VDADQNKSPYQRRVTGRYELRQKRDIENAHFGIEHIAQHSSDKPVPLRTVVVIAITERGSGAYQEL